MLKTRLVGLIIIKSGIAVQSYGFCRYLPIGKPEVVVEYIDRWGIDEIALIDIDASFESRPPDYSLVKRCAKFCQIPLSVGGGVKSMAHMDGLMRAGADKIIINSALISNPSLINEGAKVYGNQSMIASIDVVHGPQSTFEVRNTVVESTDKYSLESLATIAEENGAGEILLNCVDRDGKKTGYEINALSVLKNTVTIPVIMSGGVGCADHFVEGVKFGASAVAAANYFHYTEHSVILAKRKMIQEGVQMRLDTRASYLQGTLNAQDRPVKICEKSLSKMRFEFIEEEVI